MIINKAKDSKMEAFNYTNGAFALDENVNEICQMDKKPEVALAWKNVTFAVDDGPFSWATRKKAKVILSHLSGSFTVGSLNGLLGPSGAGKTTLLDCLSGNQRKGLSNGSEIASKEKNPTSYFIAQHVHESIVGELTVRQILQYAYKFKNESGSSSKEVNEFIGKTLQNLLLDPSILDRRFAVCSGGEQKRVAIAQELMSHQAPTFLFLDEPTTGLDSAAAYEVMSSLQALARRQCITVIASIHAPNHETLHLFDQLYVLAKGGLAIYSGPPAGIRSHLETKLQLKLDNSQQPPIEALLKVACNGSSDFEVQTLAKNHLQLESENCIDSSFYSQDNGLPIYHRPFTVSSFLSQIGRIFRIIFLCNCKLIAFNLLQYLLLFTIFSTLYNHRMGEPSSCYLLDQASSNVTCFEDLEETRLVDENITYLGYTIQLIGLLVICSSAIVFSPLVKAFQAEHRNSWYSLGVFYWASVAVSFIEITFYSLVIAGLAYFLSFQHSADDYLINWTRFGSYAFFMWLLCIYIQSIGHLIGALLMNHVEAAIIISQVMYIFMTVMNGFFVDTDKTGDPLIIGLANVMAAKYVTKGVIWTFYGIDRCDWQTEFSASLLKHQVDPELLQEYVLRVVINVLVVRMFTLLFLYLKFGSIHFSSSKKLQKSKTNEKKENPLEVDLNSAWDFYSKCESTKSETESLEIALKIGEDSKQTDFQEFSKNKVIIGWRNLSLFGDSSIYEMGGKKRKTMGKPILQNLNGEFKFGTLNALMGTSGAGKTSLLKVLNGRCKTRLGDETHFYLSKYTKMVTCFITQEVSGHLLPGLTAKQMLIYASKLKNRQSGVDHEAIAMNWLQELDLLNIESNRVEKCSGGERKRLAVALELTSLSMPNCMCIDEPTSGLDTNSAEIVMAVLHRLTRSHPLTIITSIHQPTTEILFSFDQLYVLARGGVAIYSGPPSGIQGHLDSLPNATTFQYPIEAIIGYSCEGITNSTVQHLAALTTSQTSPTSALSASTQLAPDGVLPNRSRFSFLSAFILARRYLIYILGHLWIQQLAFLLVILLYGAQLRMFFDSSIALPAGCVDLETDFNNTCSRSAQEILDEYQLTENYKFNYFLTEVFLLFLLIQSSLLFGKEFVYFANEHRNGWYSSGTFYLMKSFFEILPLPFIIMAYVAIINIYSSILPDFYWQLVFLLTLSAIGFQGMAHVCSLLANGNITVLTVISLSLFFFFGQISNFFIPFNDLHYVYQFAGSFSIGRYAFEASLLLQYAFDRCGPKEIQVVLYKMDITDGHLTECLIMLFVNFIFYRILAIYLLIRKTNPWENRRQRVTRLELYQQMIRIAKG